MLTLNLIFDTSILKCTIPLPGMPFLQPCPVHLVNSSCSFSVLEFGCQTWWSFPWFFWNLQLCLTITTKIVSIFFTLSFLGLQPLPLTVAFHVTRVRSLLCFQYWELVTLIWYPYLPYKNWGYSCHPHVSHSLPIYALITEFTSYAFKNQALSLIYCSLQTLSSSAPA